VWRASELLSASGLFPAGDDLRLPGRWRGRLIVASFADDRLLAELAADRSRLLSLNPRAFEEVCAEVMARLGAVCVRLTPAGHDGGVC
jgi:hypothetical protein